MVAVASARVQSPLAYFCKRLRDKEKLDKVTRITLVRKLLNTINAIIKTRQPYAS